MKIVTIVVVVARIDVKGRTEDVAGLVVGRVNLCDGGMQTRESRGVRATDQSRGLPCDEGVDGEYGGAFAVEEQRLVLGVVPTVPNALFRGRTKD